MRESDVESYLIRRVKALHGETRKMRWVGRAHAPDQMVLLPGRHALVELKRPGEDARAGQKREHARLRDADFEVVVLDTLEAVDNWLGD